MNIGQKIKEVRKQKSLTQKELGKRAGISQQQIAQYENGKLKPKIETIEKIADALKVPIFHLIDGTLEEKLEVYRQTEEWKKGEHFESAYGGIFALLEYLYDASIQENSIDDFQIFEVSGKNGSFLLTGEDVDYLVDYLEKIVPPIIHLLSHCEPLPELIKSLKIEQKEMLAKIPEYRKDE